jgi:hypothetical protein
MNDASCQFIDMLGGASEVAKLIRTPMTTVHSWRKTGIPGPRLDHIKLAAEARGKAEALADALSALDTDPMLPFAEAAGT